MRWNQGLDFQKAIDKPPHRRTRLEHIELWEMYKYALGVGYQIERVGINSSFLVQQAMTCRVAQGSVQAFNHSHTVSINGLTEETKCYISRFAGRKV